MPPEKMTDRSPESAAHAPVESKQRRHAECCMAGKGGGCQSEHDQATGPDQGLGRNIAHCGQNCFHEVFDTDSASGFHGLWAKVRVDIDVTL